MNKKEQILDLYFNKHLKQKEIAEVIHSSQQYISKIIKKDERYETEKSSRKSINAEKRKIAQAEYQKNYIRKKDKDIAYEQLLTQQIQDAIELSYNAHPLSNYACKKANSSIYRYDSKKTNMSINLSQNTMCNTYSENFILAIVNFEKEAIVYGKLKRKK